MKKKKLLTSKPFNLKVYGISTPLKGYKLGWGLGNLFELEFLKQTKEELPSHIKQLNFDVYRSQNEDFEQLILLQNEYEGHYFYPRFKIADFFLVHYQDGSKIQIEDVKTKVQQLDKIQTIFPLNFKNELEESLFYLDV